MTRTLGPIELRLNLAIVASDLREFTATLAGGVSYTPPVPFTAQSALESTLRDQPLAAVPLLFGAGLATRLYSAPGLRQWAAGHRASSPTAVFGMGASSGLVAAPCGASAFAAAITYVAGTGSAALGFLYLFVFSLGLTAQLVVVGLSSGALARLPAGPWSGWVRRAGRVAYTGVGADQPFLEALRRVTRP